MELDGQRRSLKERQRQEREDLILQAAEDVLAEKGYHDTSMDEIAGRVGVAKGTVYLHFASKGDLVVALIEREMQKLLQFVEQTVSLQMSARARLENILQGLYRGMLGKRVRLLVALYARPDVRKDFPKDKEHLHAIWHQLTAHIAMLLEEGKAAGEFDASLPMPVLLGTFFNLLSPWGYERLVLGEQIAPEELVKHLAHIYFEGITALGDRLDARL
jgi:TetR/AcrR family fatty acid metabolism transcriptional regulator